MRGIALILALLLAGCQTNTDRAKKVIDDLPPPVDPLHGVEPPPPLPAQSPLALNIDAPTMVTPGQEFIVRTTLTNPGERPVSAVTVHQTIPPGVQIVRTDPPAQLSNNEVAWDIANLAVGERIEITARFRADRDGKLNFSANAEADNFTRAEGQATTQVGFAQLSLRIVGPNVAARGERIPWEIRVANVGTSTVLGANVSADVDVALEHESGMKRLNWNIDALPPGEVKVIAVPLTVRGDGRLRLSASAKTPNGASSSEEHALDVREMRLVTSIAGPKRVLMNQANTWTITVRNTGTAEIANAAIRLQLPPELRFDSAIGGGKSAGGLVTWQAGTIVPGGSQRVEVTATALGIVERTTLVATAGGDRAPEAKADAPLQVVGVPLLRLSLRDSEDPVEVGGTVVYTLEAKNAGTVPLADIDITATLPTQLQPRYGAGPTLATIEGQQVSFARLAELAPGQSITIRIEAEAKTAGDARLTFEARSSTLAEPINQNEATRILPKD